MKKTGGITFHSSGNSSCGLNPFCHISRFIGSIMVFMVVGCVLCSVGYHNLLQPSRAAAEWVGPVQLEKQKIEPCCEETCVCDSIDFPDTTRQTGRCCSKSNKNGEYACSSGVFPKCTKKCIDPCFNCMSSRKYKLGDKTGTRRESKLKQPDCIKPNIDGDIYVNPKDIHDESSVPTGDLRKTGISSIITGTLSLVCFCIILLVLFKSGKFLVNSVSERF